MERSLPDGRVRLSPGATAVGAYRGLAAPRFTSPLPRSRGDRSAWAILSGLVDIWAHHSELHVLPSRASLDRSACPRGFCGDSETLRALES
jgi:hypothetical protein